MPSGLTRPETRSRTWSYSLMARVIGRRGIEQLPWWLGALVVQRLTANTPMHQDSEDCGFAANLLAPRYCVAMRAMRAARRVRISGAGRWRLPPWPAKIHSKE